MWILHLLQYPKYLRQYLAKITSQNKTEHYLMNYESRQQKFMKKNYFKDLLQHLKKSKTVVSIYISLQTKQAMIAIAINPASFVLIQMLVYFSFFNCLIQILGYGKFYLKKLSKKSYLQISHVKNIIQKLNPNFFIQNVRDLFFVTG